MEGELNSYYVAAVPVAEGVVGEPEVDAALGTQMLVGLLQADGEFVNATNLQNAIEPLSRASKCLRDRNQSGGPLYIKVQNNLGVAQLVSGNRELANICFQLARMIAEKGGPEFDQLRGGAIFNVASMTQEDGDRRTARRMFKEARSLGVK